MADKADWAAIAAAYITSDKSYKTIAAEHGFSRTAVAAKGKEENWIAQRNEYRRKNAQKAIERQGKKDVNKLLKLMEAADWLNETIAGIKKDPQQFNRHLVNQGMDGMTETVEKIFAKVDTRAIRDLSGAIKDMTTATRSLYGLPTQAEAEAQRVAAERLKLEERKTDAAEQANQVDKSIIVRLEGELEDYAK